MPVPVPVAGICKIIPPEGWWAPPDYREIIEASTHDAIPTPVQQCIGGARGVFTLDILEKPAESLKTFEAKATASAARRLPPGLSYEEREKKFWKSLSTHMEPPMYGADSLGSLFRSDRASGWNVDDLDTLLQRKAPPVAGVTDAMLYVGMWGAMFAYHVEDMNLYSINYLHTGKTTHGSKITHPRFAFTLTCTLAVPMSQP